MKYWIQKPHQTTPIELTGLVRLVQSWTELLVFHTRSQRRNLRAIEQCLKQLREGLRKLTKAQINNQCLRRKKTLLTNPQSRAALIEVLGGHKRLHRWDAAKARADIAAAQTPSKITPDWFALKVKMEARQKAAYWKRQCAIFGYKANSVDNRPCDFRLPPLPRRRAAQSSIDKVILSRGSVIEETPVRVTEMQNLPIIVVTPNELRLGFGRKGHQDPEHPKTHLSLGKSGSLFCSRKRPKSKSRDGP